MNDMELCVKRFDELSTAEMYELYRLRVAVFVVEQQCPYQEIDAHDKSALHVWLRDENGIQAYLRVLPRGTVFDEVSLGRVLAVHSRRGLGSRIVSEGIRIAKERFGADVIMLEAQTYARGLYEKQGFVCVSDEFIEDGIPHIRMRLEL